MGITFSAKRRLIFSQSRCKNIVMYSRSSYTQLSSMAAHYSGYLSLSSSVVSLISSVTFLSTAVGLLLIAVIKTLSDQSYQGLQRSGIFFDLNGISL